jgi:hypothetical protein
MHNQNSSGGTRPVVPRRLSRQVTPVLVSMLGLAIAVLPALPAVAAVQDIRSGLLHPGDAPPSFSRPSYKVYIHPRRMMSVAFAFRGQQGARLARLTVERQRVSLRPSI